VAGFPPPAGADPLPAELATELTIAGPSSIVDETTGTWSVHWQAADGTPVAGGWVTVEVLAGGGWTSVVGVGTDEAGNATFALAPREDVQLRATGSAGGWWAGAVSASYAVDNVPPVAPVAYPAAAPLPRPLPPQARAVGAGANPVITRIPNAVWASMVGRTWHRGCPVGRRSLRLIQVNYWDYAGYRRRGEMVVNRRIAGRAAAALAEMYARQFPIRSMYREDRFGWSKRLHGADDYASMAAGNSSAFNCRGVVGRPRVRSPHARGRAIDLNTWENPYRSRLGIVPNTWWWSRSDPRIAWRSAAHPVVQIWRRHGFRWTYGVNDSQHWDGRRPPSAGSFTG
jgi:hypothetical protein